MKYDQFETSCSLISDCDSIAEFWYKLINGIELSSVDDRRWPPGYLNLPHRAGKIRDISKFDHEFFGMSEHDANYTDAQMRIALETTYEAIVDAGINPTTLRGSKTAIFAGICYDDTGTAYIQDESTALNYLHISVQRISQAFDFRGGASSVDTACASSFSAFCQAFFSLKAGLCDQAIVIGTAINLTPTIALGFNNLHMTSQDGRSKCMDATGMFIIIIIFSFFFASLVFTFFFTHTHFPSHFCLSLSARNNLSSWKDLIFSF